MVKTNRGLAAVIIFIATLTLSVSCTAGKSDNDSGTKQLLFKAIQNVENLEKENRKLKNDLDQRKRDKLLKENKSLKEEGEKIKAENKALKEEVVKLRGAVSHAELRLEEMGESGNIVSALEKENKELSGQVSKLKGLVSFTELQLDSMKDQIARTEKLEARNKELKSILEKINSIAQGTPSKTVPAADK